MPNQRAYTIDKPYFFLHFVPPYFSDGLKLEQADRQTVSSLHKTAYTPHCKNNAENGLSAEQAV
ncbi:hypothetical protein l11_07160 [Neisseria weaveri LMG 5135]|nr:hypothetical protein l13_05420 [Neisseria weaveri ATCC 51223]EGV38144.1 hypothetical protein l11_07160 [Neisseria weaveri LMG 5135]